ncbi:glycosylated lysosomal membrane protein [Takifugu flavidus]|nr:glycosylated lysosomal membrane protein [Takifugu flavidus]
MAAKGKRSCRVSLLFRFSVFSFCYSLVTAGQTYQRKLSVQLNPGFHSPPGGDLLHVRAVGENDTLHYLFCSQGAPTLLLVHTNTSSSTLKVNWTQFLDRNVSGGLEVEPKSSVLYSTAVVFSKLLEYDDFNDTAQPSSTFFPLYDLQNFNWSRLNLSGSTSLLCGTEGTLGNGSLCLQLSVFDVEGRGEAWPRLLHTANSSQLKLWLDGVSPRSNHSRFLLELLAVGGAYTPSHVEIHRSIDDEFTPSMFSVSRWVPELNGSRQVPGFFQWKPVAYRQPHPVLEDATSCHHSDPLPQSGETAAAMSGLIRAFYTEPEVFGLNVSFGLAGDPFYNSTRFLSWTLLAGVGSPPMDSISPLVISMMAVGLGVPLVFVLLGSVYVCTRKTVVTTPYQPIN